jgi:hypothetical protein
MFAGISEATIAAISTIAPQSAIQREREDSICPTYHLVMAGLVPAIHVFAWVKNSWMPGTRPGMTKRWSGAS